MIANEHAVWWDKEGARGAGEINRAENLHPYTATLHKNAYAKAKPSSGFTKIVHSMYRMLVQSVNSVQTNPHWTIPL